MTTIAEHLQLLWKHSKSAQIKLESLVAPCLQAAPSHFFSIEIKFPDHDFSPGLSWHKSHKSQSSLKLYWQKYIIASFGSVHASCNETIHFFMMLWIQTFNEIIILTSVNTINGFLSSKYYGKYPCLYPVFLLWWLLCICWPFILNEAITWPMTDR